MDKQKKEKKSLARGLRALIPDSEPKKGEEIVEISLDSIDPNPMQPRENFDPESLEELKSSILQVGVMTPVILRKSGDRYQLVAGARRVEASKLAGLRTIPSIIRDTDSEELLLLALIENVQRDDLNEMELAYAYRQLKDEFFLTQHQIAEKVGKSRSVIANTLRLLELSQNIQQAVRDGEITSGHARALLALDEEKRDRVLEIIRRKSLSVRDVEEMVKKAGTHEESTDKAEKRDSDAKESTMTLDPDTKKVLDIIQEHLRTKVELQSTKRGGEGGKIVIHYYGKDDFNYIFQELLNLCGRSKVQAIMDEMTRINEELNRRHD